jgi:hypothetical protein
VRRDEQPLAACGRQQPGCRGKQRAVTRAQLRALDVTAQDLELMAQHEQLDVLDVNGPAAADQQLQQRYEREVDERQGHRAILSGARAKPAIEPHQSFGTLQAVRRVDASWDHRPARRASRAGVCTRCAPPRLAAAGRFF